MRTSNYLLLDGEIRLYAERWHRCRRRFAAVEVVRANGLEIAYERVGEGPPLVFVHGAAEDGRVWQPQLAALADEFTVVAWDEPGAGRSSDVPADFGLADYANCLAALIEALALGPGARRRPLLGRHRRRRSSIATIPGSSRR